MTVVVFMDITSVLVLVVMMVEVEFMSCVLLITDVVFMVLVIVVETGKAAILRQVAVDVE